MKKLMLFMLVLMFALSLHAEWKEGEVVDKNYSWVDSNGESHSIYELTESGKTVMIFWGELG